MPVVKPVDGHTRCVNVMRYLTKKDRALACDYLNIDATVAGYEAGLPVYEPLDWAHVMDETRRRFGNDLPHNGKRARTYKHYIVSPDPADRIDFASLRELATTWAAEHFADYQVAIVYHDDNAGGIPHAHLVVNNTDLETGRRLQVPDPKALNRSLQRMAAERGLRAFDNIDRAGAEREADSSTGRRPPRTLQKVHRSRAESELVGDGRYSWVADIRARVEIARGVATDEPSFRDMLASMGVTVSDNSPKARRPDWVYALADKPARRVSGEKLGLLYSKESLQRRFAYGGARMSEVERDIVAEIARSAIELRNLGELRALADAVGLIDSRAIRSTAELDAAIAHGEVDGNSAAAAMARESGMLRKGARESHRGESDEAREQPLVARGAECRNGRYRGRGHRSGHTRPHEGRGRQRHSGRGPVNER